MKYLWLGIWILIFILVIAIMAVFLSLALLLGKFGVAMWLFYLAAIVWFMLAILFNIFDSYD